MSSFFSMDSPVMRFLSRVCDLMILNLMTIVCCIPIVTAGASLTALYTITLKMVRGEEAYIFKGFLKAFKENFKISTITWLIMLAIGIFFYIDFQAAEVLPGNMASFFKVLIGAVTVFYVMILTYIFPYIARFENNLKNTFKNALLISILNLPYTLLILLVPAALVIITFLSTATLVYGSLLWILLGFACVAYVQSRMFRKVFAKYEPEAAAPENPDDYIVPEELPETASENKKEN